MTCRPACHAARRHDCPKSTGPRTDAARAAARAVPVRQGLVGLNLALSTEDVAEIDRRFASITAELNPQGDLAFSLTRRIALLTVRLDRSGRHEAATTSERVRNAIAAYDEARQADIDRLMGQISENPAAHVRALRRMPEGIDRMLKAWRGLRGDVARAEGFLWSGTHREIADELCGRHADATTMSPLKAMSQDFFSAAAEEFKIREGDTTAATARRDQIRDQILGMIDGEIADLETTRAGLDLEALALDRAGAADRALFDTSAEAILARKYDAATERSLFRTLRELRELRELSPIDFEPATESAEVIDDESVTASDPERLASFRADASGDSPDAVEPEPVEATDVQLLASFGPATPNDRLSTVSGSRTGPVGDLEGLGDALASDPR